LSQNSLYATLLSVTVVPGLHTVIVECDRNLTRPDVEQSIEALSNHTDDITRFGGILTGNLGAMRGVRSVLMYGRILSVIADAHSSLGPVAGWGVLNATLRDLGTTHSMFEPGSRLVVRYQPPRRWYHRLSGSSPAQQELAGPAGSLGRPWTEAYSPEALGAAWRATH
jgi:hypothetical protein